MAIFPGSAIPSAVSDYEIDNSVRFEDADSAELSRTFGSAGDQTAWTFSAWIKRVDRAEDIGARPVFGAYTDSSNWSEIRYHSDHDSLRWIETISGSTVGQLRTSASYRDPSSWYHITCTWDSDNGTSGNRMRMYVNGEEVTAFATDTNPSSGQVSATNKACEHTVGSTRDSSSTYYTSGYMAEVYFIDGTALTPSTFGELDSDTNQWKPLDSDDVKDAVSFGTNGFFQKYNSTELAASFVDSTEGGFKPSENITADVLIVAGGGGGGWAPHSAGGGGGGGGGFKYFSQKSLTADVALSVTVGAGGAGQKEGGDSSFGSDTSAGGGAGDMTTAGGSYTGGSGGGGRYNTSGHAGTANQGNAGGNGYGSHPSYSGGGGGGASAVGGNGSGNGGAGGAGYSTGDTVYDWNQADGTTVTFPANFTDGSSTTSYAGGGGGSSSGAQGSGGTGGGAAGRGGGGTTNTGGGGGGGDQSTGEGGGGSGIVIVRYQASSAKATGGTITTYGSGASQYYVHTFTSSASNPRHTITANGDVKNVRGANLDTTYANPVSFTSSTTWTVPTGVTSVSYLVVGGGGGGGGAHQGAGSGGSGGGGGSGGYRTGTLSVTPGASVTVTVGAGGSAGAANTTGGTGGDSVFSSITSKGGGGGGKRYEVGSDAPTGGGSGGGAGSSGNGTTSGGTGSTYGNNGGTNGGYGKSGGGGGGSAAVGSNAPSNSAGGAGGAGTSNDISGSSVTYAAGGAGGFQDNHTSGATGATNTGNGGGGGQGGNNVGGAGGSGIVVIAYDLAKPGSSSIRFDGTGDYLSTAASSDWNFGTDDFTVEFWANGDPNTTRRESFTLGAGSNNINFDFNESSSPIWVYWGSDGSADASQRITPSGSAGDYTDGKWRHLALVRNGTTVTFYVDGASVGSQTGYSSALDCSASGVQIGRMTSSGVADWLGYMDEVRISNTARYTTTFTPQRTQFTADANTLLLIHSDWTGGLGADSSGNLNNFTATNLVATDQMIDTPTNSFATFNGISYGDNGGNFELREGNLQAYMTSGVGKTHSTFSLFDDGCYWEMMVGDTGGGYGIALLKNANLTTSSQLGADSYSEIAYRPSTGNLDINGSTAATYATASAGDILNFAFKSGRLYVGKSNTWFNSGNPAGGSGYVNSSAVTGDWCAACSLGANSPNYGSINFGADSSFAGKTTAQGNQDGNGKGDFYYAPPSGFLALCTDNLPDPEIALPGEHFNTVLYTGDGNTTHAITGVGFKPDMNWVKARGFTKDHNLVDSVRGAHFRLIPNDTNAENEDAEKIVSLDSDGFTTGVDSATNDHTEPYVAWNWKAGGAGVSNTEGSLDATVSANTTAGFSIVRMDEDGTGGTATVGHGLSKAPELIIGKPFDAGDHWRVGSDFLTSWVYIMRLDTDAAEASFANCWASTAPTSTLVTMGSDGLNNTGYRSVLYCFHSVEGYSKVGSYTGNANADGTFIYTGFRPAFLIAKNYGAASKPWVMYDDKRDTYNEMYKQLVANDNMAANTSEGRLDFVSNGIKWRIGDSYHNDGSFIYIAFAESPFKYSNAR